MTTTLDISQETISPDSLVGTVAGQFPHALGVFDALGIDYCCGGKATLRKSAERAGVDIEKLLSALESGLPQPAAESTDWSLESLTKLADNIEATHHAYLKSELPELEALAAKVARVHGGHTPSLVELHRIVEGFRHELESHMMKEERILFPMIREMESTGTMVFHCGGLENPIRVMEMEHDSAGNALETMNKLTDGFTPPEGACSSYRRLFTALAKLEADMHRHVHKENNILFPRALAFRGEG